MPYSTQLNPPLWEVGHVGWFQDYWIARSRQRALGIGCEPDHERPDGRLPGADALYDSSNVAHATRWHLPLPDLAATRAYLAEGLAETLQLLAREAETPESLYFYRLALFHEDMHAEAATYMAQALDLPLPAALRPTERGLPAAERASRCRRRTWRLGYEGTGFAFDNELVAHEVQLDAFAIDSAAVSWRRFMPAIEAGAVALPRYLRRENGAWRALRFGAWQALNLDAAAVHLTWDEAAGLVRLGRAPPADRSRMGVRGSDRAGIRVGRCLGMDHQPFRALRRLRRPSLPRLLALRLRGASLRAARRQRRHLAAHGPPALPQLLHRRAQRHSRRVP